MNTSVMVWLAVVGLFVLVVLVNAMIYAVHHGPRGLHLNHIFSWGSERDEFYVPGDPEQEEAMPYEED